MYIVCTLMRCVAVRACCDVIWYTLICVLVCDVVYGCVMVCAGCCEIMCAGVICCVLL